jgi:hypothetical protein
MIFRLEIACDSGSMFHISVPGFFFTGVPPFRLGGRCRSQGIFERVKEHRVDLGPAVSALFSLLSVHIGSPHDGVLGDSDIDSPPPLPKLGSGPGPPQMLGHCEWMCCASEEPLHTEGGLILKSPVAPNPTSIGCCSS